MKDLSLGLFRSDYMVHVDPSTANPTPQIKQVEFNTIASSFGGLSSQVSFLHKYVFPIPLSHQLLNFPHRHLLSISAYPTPLITLSSLPPSPSTASLSLGLATAHKAYGPSKSAPALPLCILFIVHPHEPNLFDQAHLSTTLQQTHQIPTFRLPFASILSQTHIPQISSRPLIYTPPHSPNTPHEATTLYFRAGYDPSSYPTPQSWHSRLHLERSAAIKCPSILTHLAGSKKIQQVLATPSSPNLSRFTSNPETAARIQNTFAAIYPLDSSPAGEKAKAIATDEGRSAGYVLKPQREGGGNNIYRRKIPAFLRSLGDESRWRGHILMELIEPPALQNSLMRNGEVRSGEVIGELGIYGVCLWRSGRKPALEESSTQQQQQRRPEGGMAVVANWEAGYLLRTKGRESEEGGVAAGFGAVDSACLV